MVAITNYIVYCFVEDDNLNICSKTGVNNASHYLSSLIPSQSRYFLSTCSNKNRYIEVNRKKENNEQPNNEEPVSAFYLDLIKGTFYHSIYGPPFRTPANGHLGTGFCLHPLTKYEIL